MNYFRPIQWLIDNTNYFDYWVPCKTEQQISLHIPDQDRLCLSMYYRKEIHFLWILSLSKCGRIIQKLNKAQMELC